MTLILLISVTSEAIWGGGYFLNCYRQLYIAHTGSKCTICKAAWHTDVGGLFNTKGRRFWTTYKDYQQSKWPLLLFHYNSVLSNNPFSCAEHVIRYKFDNNNIVPEHCYVTFLSELFHVDYDRMHVTELPNNASDPPIKIWWTPNLPPCCDPRSGRSPNFFQE